MLQFNVQYADAGWTLPKDYSVKIESDAEIATLDSLHITMSVILIGHSYGGVTVFDLAINHPNRTKSLVLVEAPLFDIAKRRWLKQKDRLKGLSVVSTYKIDFKKIHAFTKHLMVVTGTNTIEPNKTVDSGLECIIHWLLPGRYFTPHPYSLMKINFAKPNSCTYICNRSVSLNILMHAQRYLPGYC